MSTATLERVALPEGFEASKLTDEQLARLGWDRIYEATLTRGATSWRVQFGFGAGPLRERIVLDDEPFHRPVVNIFKRAGWRESPVMFDEAPLYVQKFINQNLWQVAEFEQQRHGVPAMTMAEFDAMEAREEARKRQVVQLLARDVREAAQCGTANSEAIAAWILENFVEKCVHEDVLAEHRETLQEIAGERENEHAEIIEELNAAIDIAKRADDAIAAMAASADALKQPSALEFACGTTDAEKALDVLSDGLWAIDAYQWNLSNSDLPEKREVK